MKRLPLLMLFIALYVCTQGQDTIRLQVPTPCSSPSFIDTRPDTDFGFSIFPNPSTGVFRLQIKDSEELGLMNLTVTSVHGALVYQTRFYASGKEMQTSVNLSNLSNGHYIVSLSNKQKIASKKLILKK